MRACGPTQADPTPWCTCEIVRLLLEIERDKDIGIDCNGLSTAIAEPLQVSAEAPSPNIFSEHAFHVFIPGP